MGDFDSNTNKPQNNFTGLTKEKVKKISHEKKWIVIQAMFTIGFGIVWFAIFVKVVLVIIEVAKCLPEPKLIWYHDNIVYKVHVQEYAGNLNGLRQHLPYIDNIKAETILVRGVMKEKDPTAVIHDQEDAFKKLVQEVHAKRDRKIITEIVVDSLSIENEKFLESASQECQDANISFCNMFVWESIKPNTLNISEEEWTYDLIRNESFMNSDGKSDRVLINYGSNESLPYILKVLDAWLSRGLDGLLVRDVSKLHGISREKFVDEVWKNQHFSTVNASIDNRALYVSSSTPQSERTPISFLDTEGNNVHSPVFVTAQLNDFVGKEGAGDLIEEYITTWRTESRFINGYEIGSMDEPLAASLTPDYAAGLVLLLLTLPGVPMLRSGDEVLSTSGIFSWNSDSLHIDFMNGNEAFLKEVKRLITLRVSGVRSKQSLRFDTKDNDTDFTFLNLGNSDILAYRRQWSTRDPVMVVSNMSPNDHAISLAIPLEDDMFLTKAKILASSVPARFEKDSVISLGLVELKSGTTLVLEAN